jgi:hypothetical protein
MLSRALPLLLLAHALGAQQPQVYLRSAPDRESAAIVAAALAGTPTVVNGEGRLQLPRDTAYGGSVVVLGRETAVASTVHGDVVVLGGDLFLHPGATIDGDVIAVGGGVYDSDLATVRGRRLAFRDVRVDLVRTDSGVAVDLSEEAQDTDAASLTLPVLYGLRGGEYNRVDGAAITWGPRLSAFSSRVVVEPIATYRSERGLVDPGLRIGLDLGSGWSLLASGERTTISNDRWIQSDALNSLTTFVLGKDVRNYYRAERYEAGVQRQLEYDFASVSLMLMGRWEDASSISAGHPWSVWERDDPDGIIRINPPISDGQINSALAGFEWRWGPERLVASASAVVERSFKTPTADDFTQLTLHGELAFSTFGAHTMNFSFHGVATASEETPRQRYVYLGGTGTLSTFDPLQFGGDQLAILESHYDIPISHLDIVPLLGPPVFSVRYLVGSAGVDALPKLEQNVGVRLTWGFMKFSFTVEPVSSYSEFSIGLGLTR